MTYWVFRYQGARGRVGLIAIADPIVAADLTARLPDAAAVPFATENEAAAFAAALDIPAELGRIAEKGT